MSIETHSQPVLKTSSDRGLNFVNYIIGLCQVDNGLRAKLKRADNPATEYQSWETLAGFHIDLTHDNQRLPFASIAAALARAKVDSNGGIKIGQAIASCYADGNDSDQAKAKLRRLLACESVAEACRILRPLFSLIDAKGAVKLDYANLLNDLLWFSHDDSQIRIKARWAQGFYGKAVDTGSQT